MRVLSGAAAVCQAALESVESPCLMRGGMSRRARRGEAEQAEVRCAPPPPHALPTLCSLAAEQGMPRRSRETGYRNVFAVNIYYRTIRSSVENKNIIFRRGKIMPTFELRFSAGKNARPSMRAGPCGVRQTVRPRPWGAVPIGLCPEKATTTF